VLDQDNRRPIHSMSEATAIMARRIPTPGKGYGNLQDCFHSKWPENGPWRKFLAGKHSPRDAPFLFVETLDIADLPVCIKLNTR
jgi:hypothetical protein